MSSGSHHADEPVESRQRDKSTVSLAGSTSATSIPDSRFVPGTILADRYRIVGRLGVGGMGEVYRAEDLKLGVFVALKFLPASRADDQGWLRRLHDEVRVAREVAHPNVCRVYDIADVDGEHFISMEHVDGEDLKALIRRVGQLSRPKTLQIARQICEGLAASHARRVLHRDLKPSNIMLDGNGNVRITDFGIAAIINEPGAMETGVGSPAYMSPEQFIGGEISLQTDLFALGLVLYEIFTGKVAVTADSTEQIEHAHRSGRTPVEMSRLAGLDSGIAQLIRRCLARDPKDRPASASDVAAALEAIEAEANVAGQDTASRSIAVLPFADMSEGKDQEYFCEGMAEEILNSLTKLEGVRVASRTSSFQFKTAADIREIGERLNVNTVLEGSVRKAGDRLRVTAQLINVEDGFHLWSDRFDRQMKDVFEIQDEIAQAIVTTLKGRLEAEKHALSVRRYTDNVEAYELYLKGRYVESTRRRSGFTKGIEYFKAAIEKDPSYALAYAGLAESYSLLAWYRFLPPREAFPKAGAAASEALRIDETLPEAHTSQAVVRFYYDWDWEGTERSFKRALEFDPGDAIALHGYAEYLAARKQLDESLELISRAHEIDPLSLTISAGLGWIHFFSRRFEAAAQHFEKTLELDPDYVFLHWFLGQAYWMAGMKEQAVASLRRGLSRSDGHPAMAAYLGYMCGQSGRREEAEKIHRDLEDKARQAYLPSDYLSVVSMGLDRTDEALGWLEKACDERALHLVFLAVDPLFDSLRSEPRFKRILATIGLEQ